MIDLGKYPVLGVNIDAVDYEAAVNRIVEAARKGRGYGVSALAVHGVMTGFMDETHRRRLNGLELVTPDGQPVRWSLKWKHGVELANRVYGPQLTLEIIKAAAEHNLSIYFYGSTEKILNRLEERLVQSYPGIRISGMEPSKFRTIDRNEKEEVIRRIRESKADIVFVGLGCPRQEVWAFEYKDELKVPVIAVGAAFPFHAGTLPQAPAWMQRSGLEWLFRLLKEPVRLWRRYLILNPLFLFNIAKEVLNISQNEALKPEGNEPVISYG